MQNHKIEISGAVLNVLEQGEGEIALVFLHYWGGTSRTYRRLIEALAGARRCIAFDQRGWGASTKEGDFGLEAYARDTIALIEKLNLSRYVLIGHSMGGKVAQLVASRHPVGLAGLVLIAPAPPTPVAAPQEQRQMMLASYQTREGVEMALNVLAHKPLRQDDREQVIVDSLGGAPAAKAAWTEAGMIADISAAARRIDVPTLVIVGDADRVESEEILRREIPPAIAHAQFAILTGVGHLAPLEAPDEMAMAIARFVDPLKK
jgi:pimeloyl-ACP methyl ester carboxylesterase